MIKDPYFSTTVRLQNNQLFRGKEMIAKYDEALPLKDFLKHLYGDLELNYSKFHKMDLLSKLGIIAVETLTRGESLPEDTALVFQNNAGSGESDWQHQQRLQNPKKAVSPAVFVYTLPNIVMGEIAIQKQLTGEQAFFIAEEFDAALLYNYVDNLWQTAKASQVITGWINLDEDGYHVFLTLITSDGFAKFTAQKLDDVFKE